MYAYSQDTRILNDPEDFGDHIPSNTYQTYYYDTAFNYQYDAELNPDMPVEGSYLMFMGGDNKIVKIKTDVHNGRKLLVMKDSYGNAEIPFYTGSFEEIYVTDMRYFDCNLVSLYSGPRYHPRAVFHVLLLCGGHQCKRAFRADYPVSRPAFDRCAGQSRKPLLLRLLRRLPRRLPRRLLLRSLKLESTSSASSLPKHPHRPIDL